MLEHSFDPSQTKSRRFLRALIGSCAAFAIAAATATAFAHQGAVSKPLAAAGPLATRNAPLATPSAQELTTSLLDANAARVAAGPAERAARLAELISIAGSRHAALAALTQSDPAEVLSVALAADERASFPAEAAVFLEQDALEDGELEVYHVDFKDPALNTYLYFLKTAHGKLSLHFAGQPPALLSGTKVRAHGVKIDNMLALDGDGVTVQQLKAAPVTNALGAQRTLVILVNFADNAVQPYAGVDAQAVVFGTTSNFFLENSYQQTWLSGDVVGWFTVAISSTLCDYATIAGQAQSAAVAAGVNLGAYTHQVFAFPQNACGWWGLSSVGGSPSQSWINGSLELGVTGHELGHGLGLWHSHSLDCGTTSVIGTSCSSNEYGDILDMMGASHSAHFNAVQKERLGWLNSGVSPPITTVLASGTYTLETFEPVGSGAKALKILKSTDPGTGLRTWYYVESRQAIGFDAFLAGEANNVVNGVLIHTGAEGNGNASYLLDLTPATPVYYWWFDPALAAGQNFSDPTAGVSVTTSWVNGNAAAVTVTLSGSGTTPISALAVSTDQASYTINQPVSIKATVTTGGLPVANVKVSFSVKKPTGAVVTGSATTGTNGVATYKLRLSRKDPVGTYEADATALTRSAAANFTVH